MQARTFAERLVFFRTEAGLSCGELANLAGVTRAAVSNWEHGRTPTAANLLRLAKALGIRPGLLIDGEALDPSSSSIDG